MAAESIDVGAESSQMAAEATELRVALATAPDAKVATRLARALVDERLVACANLVSQVRSIYRWQGRVEEAGEVMLVLKTRADRIDALAERLRALHPYDVPELVVLPVVGGLASYLEWLRAEAAP